jgi:tetratricopeptide (TPR) repeat protein
MMKKIKFILNICCLLLAHTFFVVGNSYAQNLDGKFIMVKDSDGKLPKKDAVISLQFKPEGTFTFKAVMPGTTIDDKGTYKINGNNITITFNEMEQGKNTGNYFLEDGTLKLPFKMLDTEKGNSIWQKEGTVNVANSITNAPAIELINKVIVYLNKAGNNWQKEIDKYAAADTKKTNGSIANSYYILGIQFRLKGYPMYAAYAMAMAAKQQPNNGLFVNNLAMFLIEIEKNGDAISLLNDVIKNFPNLAPAYGNLAIAYININDLPKANKAITSAIQKNKGCGSYYYTKGIIEQKEGKKEDAAKSFEKAFENGYSGTAKKATKKTNIQPNQKNTIEPQKNINPTTKNSKLSNDEKLAVWAGTYQAQYMKARSGESNADANTKFGEGVATTILNLQTLACVKSFTMNISKSGSIDGSAEIMYVYQGKASGPFTALAPAPIAATQGGFGAVLKDGFQIRNWSFTGKVSPDGAVEIAAGLPTEKLDLYNVGQWQKISPWSPLKPDAAGAAMKGPFHFTLIEGKDGKHFAKIDDYVALTDKLIKKVHYQTLIVKTEESIIPDCKALAPEPEANQCPASEYIKTKLAVSPGKALNISKESSATYSKDNKGNVTKTIDNAVNLNGEIGSEAISDVVEYITKNATVTAVASIASAAIEIHTDNSFEITAGIGVSSDKIVPGFPVEFSERLDLVYDSKCGWGVKATAGAKIKIGAASSTGGSIEGVIFFNKGL